MKINKIRYRNYGKFIDRDIEFGSNLSVVLGNNEAGKSTMFQSIVDLLFGFEPANRDKNIYTNWKHNEINFNSEIFQNGELFEVDRRLMSVPKYALLNKSTSQLVQGRNDVLPWMNKISKELYKTVYHITADSLNSMQHESWAEIQDRLIYNYGMPYLNKTANVLKDMDKKINTLWRSDRKGAPKINLLVQKKFELEREKKRLESQFDYVNQVEQDVIALKNAYEKTEFDYKQTSIKLKTFESLLVYKEKMNQISRLKGHLCDFEYPGNLLEDRQKIVARLKELEQELQQLHVKLKEVDSRKVPLDTHENILIENSKRIVSLENLASQLEGIDQKLHEHADKMLAHLDKMDQQFMVLLGSKASDALVNQIFNIDPFEMKNKVQAIMNHEKENEINLLNKRSKKKSTITVGILLIVVGGIFLFMERFGTLWPLLGMGAIGFGISNTLRMIGHRSDVLFDTEDMKNEVRKMLGIINPPDYIWTDASFVFFLKMEQLLALSVEKGQMEEKRRVLTEAYNDLKDQVKSELSYFNVDSNRNELLSARMIRMDFDRLQAKIMENEKLDMELSFLGTSKSQLEAKILEERDALGALERIIETFGIDAVSKHYESLSRIKFIQEELDEKVDQVKTIIEIEKNEAIDNVAVLKYESELDLIAEERKRIQLKLHEKESELAVLKESLDLDLVSDQLIQLNMDINSLERERDILMISKTILAYSDLQYRLKNQPEIIQLVSKFMGIITGGKYNKVFLDETTEVLLLHFQVGEEIIPLSKAFSKGTINQLFFAFRLAVIQLLDPEGNYPLVLDEALINWDSTRLDQTIQLIDSVSETRQVIATTCHPTLAERLEKCQLSKKVIL